ncbi:N-6 DNA methylase [Candidatus Tisiphia endosymbiont of Nemotelus uliginosus]|uniref:N-6 DNA methylase n=1 Tax=unclassified Candidatus Tisiphia TaxID=2996318 RepID=UPI0035CB0945
MVEKHSLENVISLPKGAFADASIKSNILIAKKKQNKSKNHIWYFDLRNDGYTLNKARKKYTDKTILIFCYQKLL